MNVKMQMIYKTKVLGRLYLNSQVTWEWHKAGRLSKLQHPPKP